MVIQDQRPQQQHLVSTQSFYIGRRDNYNKYVLAALIGYANVVKNSDISGIWRKFQQSKELADNRQELKKFIECWARMKRIMIKKLYYFSS